MNEFRIDGLSTFDVVIIGAGPAGISAAIWCADLGLSHVVLEKCDDIGGQLNWAFNRIVNYPGTLTDNGAEMLTSFRTHSNAVAANIRTNSSVAFVDVNGRIVGLNNGEKLRFGSLVIATGVRRRMLGVPGEIEFAGRGILSSGAKEIGSVAGKNVVVIGGGDAALENASMMSKTAGSVIVLNRSRHFRARSDFLDQAGRQANVQLIENMQVRRFIGDSSLAAVAAENIETGECFEYAADASLIRIGVVPNSEEFADLVTRDRDGYIATDKNGMTNLEGVYAVGDIAHPDQMTLANAAFSASAAVRDIKAKQRNS
ncbi:MAG: FAD-dependent oxidoreductase [Acidobacteriota bacterium]|nr:MAG: FAD-dependent oxidoreductase [Acidobacteriota bacterium]